MPPVCRPWHGVTNTFLPQSSGNKQKCTIPTQTGEDAVILSAGFSSLAGPWVLQHHAGTHFLLPSQTTTSPDGSSHHPAPWKSDEPYTGPNQASFNTRGAGACPHAQMKELQAPLCPGGTGWVLPGILQHPHGSVAHHSLLPGKTFRVKLFALGSICGNCLLFGKHPNMFSRHLKSFLEAPFPCFLSMKRGRKKRMLLQHSIAPRLQ